MKQVYFFLFIIGAMPLLYSEASSIQHSLKNSLANQFKAIPSTEAINEYIERQVSPQYSGNCMPKGQAERKLLEKNVLCDYPELGGEWIQNCEELFTNSPIPKDALTYTMKAFALNFKKFNNKNCYLYKKDPRHYSLAGLSRDKFEEKMSGGIPNKCQIVINNTKEKISTYRGKMYFIDICQGKVTESYFNMGTGTFSSNYANVSGKNSTVKGIFLTGAGDFDFQPTGRKSKRKYKKIRKYLKAKYGEAKAHAVQLIGLQSTNNGSGPDSKYMHVSPYQSSWGCPSIDKDNYWMIKELASNGPSLVVNYGTDMQDLEDINNCGSRKN